ncbi:hypothetical protein [Marinobacter sp. CHS3-4]|uniref:tetratricopeptide repeat protein n=1 Tax=Marinobacter sp. CHS3-4 TaxID=3045174 RepID=UPI0024B50F14|nr:hypothetical protein [Marinobacter sp. CHS3-4]MDI9244964.1 hypothetical protein [Marinobacter sp. CHS3-4]
MQLPRIESHSLTISFGLILILMAGWFSFSPGLSGPFMLDDFDNLGALEVGVTDIESFEEYMSIGNAGPLDRPISKISFLINDNAWPSDPAIFKSTNIFLHLLIGITLFCLFRQLAAIKFDETRADWVALFAAGLWLLHPFQVSTVLYAVQRMTQLSALFLLLGVAIHVWLRRRDPETSLRTIVYLCLNAGICGVLAIFSKENGALLPVFLAVVELTLLRNLGGGQLLYWWRRLALWIPSLVIIGYIMYLPRWDSGYVYRDFSFSERLLTEPVIIWNYLHSIVTFQVYKLGLFQDDFPIYSSLFNPVVLVSILAHAALVIAAFVMKQRLPLFSLGVLWFYAGHLIESTTVALELYFEHRNYLSIAGLSFAFMALILEGFRKISGEFEKFYLIFPPLVLLLAASITWGFSGEWGDEDTIIPIWAAEHPDSPRAQRTFAQHLANRGFPDAALDHLERSHETFGYDLSIPFIAAGISCAFDRPLRFDPSQLKADFDSFRWTDGLRPAAKHLEDLMIGADCPSIAVSYAEVLELAERFEDARPTGIASLLVISGNIHLKSGNGDAALRLYEKVDEISRSVSSATRIAGLFLGANQYAQARQALEVAIERDAGTGISEEKMEQYKELFDRIDRQLNNNKESEESSVD